MIPKIIHQWIGPGRLADDRTRSYAESWRAHHPDWEYRLWSAAEIESGSAILQRHGGIYVDLDVECFRSIEPLVAGCELAIGVDPDTRTLSPALVAARPGAFARDGIRLIPVVDARDGALFDILRWDVVSRQAAALHHGRPHAAPRVQPEVLRPHLRLPVEDGEPAPLVSAMMVTRNRPDKALLAVECFRRQTYANKQLVIVDDGGDDTLANAIARLGDPQIQMVRLPDRDAMLGALRNVAVEASAGTYVCQWDDDDLYHPLRLETQMHHIATTGAQACLLSRWMIWWVAAGRFAVSEKRGWEGSVVCRKDVLPRYPPVQAFEDVPAMRKLHDTACVVWIDQPRLYVYIVHGTNTWFPKHFEPFWNHAERRFEGPDGARVHRELARDVPLDAYARTVG